MTFPSVFLGSFSRKTSLFSPPLTHPPTLRARAVPRGGSPELLGTKVTPRGCPRPPGGLGLGAHLRTWARVSVTVLQRLRSPSRRLGSSLRNLTASTSTRSTTRILLCRPGNWAARGHGCHLCPLLPGWGHRCHFSVPSRPAGDRRVPSRPQGTPVSPLYPLPPGWGHRCHRPVPSRGHRCHRRVPSRPAGDTSVTALSLPGDTAVTALSPPATQGTPVSLLCPFPPGWRHRCHRSVSSRGHRCHLRVPSCHPGDSGVTALSPGGVPPGAGGVP